MEALHGICRVSIAPLRSEPSDRSEMVSQLLFGDFVRVLEKTERWYRIRNSYDDYEGWMDFRQLTYISDAEYHASQQSEFLVPPAVNNRLKTSDGSFHYLAASSNLPKYENGACFLGTEKFELDFEPFKVQTFVSENGDRTLRQNKITEFAQFYLNAPYLWGGRTLSGIDCSGFVQAVFKMAGIKLLRDAAQQALEGTTVDFLPEVQTGDVAFFDNEEGKITHVGILLSQKEIIHSSARVRIDPMDDQGIFNKELNRYTHKLRIIKRYL